MMQQFLIIIVLLLLLICAAAVTLFLDARQRRIDRQLAIALSTSHSESVPSIRRAPVESRWLFFHRLANYKAGISYDWRPEYVLLAGAIAAAAVFYANSLVGFLHPLRVYRGCLCGRHGGAGSVRMAAPSPRQSTVSTTPRHDQHGDKRRSVRSACERSVSHHHS